MCNKKYRGNSRFYGSSCVKNLYRNTKIDYSKDIEDKELYLHSAIILKLGKTNLSKQKMNYVCESYLSKYYFQKLNFSNNSIIDSHLNYCINNDKKPIMKLNTAYRISNILKRNKKKIELANIDDKTIDETTLKFFKHYFSLIKLTDKTSYEVYYYMQIIFWDLVIIGGIFKKYELSSICLKNSLSVIGEEPKDIKITNKDKKIISEIKEDSGFQEKIKKLIKKYSKNNIIKFNKDNAKNINDVYYSFNSDDLFYSLHNVAINLNGKKEKGKWNLQITLTDTYDFTEILSNDKFTKKGKKYISLGTMLNDMGAVSSQYGVIKPFNITITFDWGDFDV